jgi:hypothetical protein
MLIEVSRIPPEGLDVALPAGELDLGDSAGVWEGPVTVQAAMHLSRSGRGLVIGGTFAGMCPDLQPLPERFPFQMRDRFDLYCEIGPRCRQARAELDEMT